MPGTRAVSFTYVRTFSSRKTESQGSAANCGGRKSRRKNGLSSTYAVPVPRVHAQSRARFVASQPGERVRGGTVNFPTANDGSLGLLTDYRPEEADAISGSIRASGFTMSSASLFNSSFVSDSSSSVCCRSSADLSWPSSCANVRTLP